MNNMAMAIVPKSDQLNADDLLSGPITIKITGVTIKSGEQPVSIFYEGDNGKPYKPCKSMCRVMVSAWGADASKYTGRAMTLYCDPKVKWGGMEVGGIRISHMTDIDSSITMALTVTRANKKPFTVRQLAPGAQPKAEPQQKPDSAPSATSGGSDDDKGILPDPSSSAVGSAPTDESLIADIAVAIGARDYDMAFDLARSIKDQDKQKRVTDRIGKKASEAQA